MRQDQATPRPWQLETVRTSIGVCHKIGPLGSTTKLHHACLYDDCYSAVPRDLQLLADAQLIVEAVNSHDALRASHTRLLEDVQEIAKDLRNFSEDLREKEHLSSLNLYASEVAKFAERLAIAAEQLEKKP